MNLFNIQTIKKKKKWKEKKKIVWDWEWLIRSMIEPTLANLALVEQNGKKIGDRKQKQREATRAFFKAQVNTFTECG